MEERETGITRRDPKEGNDEREKREREVVYTSEYQGKETRQKESGIEKVVRP